MRTRTLIILAAVVALLLATPFILGWFTENSVRNGIEEFASRPTFTASIDTYDRGWLGSQAHMQFGIDQALLDDIGALAGTSATSLLGTFTLPVVVDLEHGPILRSPSFGLGTTSIHAYLDPDSQLAQTAQTLLGMPYFIDFRGRGTLGLGFDYEGDIPPVDIALPDFTFETSGADFSGSFGGSDRQFAGNIEHVSVQAMFVSAIVDAIGVTSNMQRVEPGDIPLGTSVLTIGRLAISDPFQGIASSFTADNVSVSSAVSEATDRDFLDFAARYAADAVTVGGEFTVSEMQLGLQFAHLDADAVNELYQLTSSDRLSSNPAALEAELMPVLGRLLAGEAVFSVDPVSFSMPQGDASGRMTMTLGQNALPPGGTFDATALMLAMQSAVVTVDLTASKPLVQELMQQYLRPQLAAASSAVPGAAPLPPDQLAAQAEMQTNLMLLALSAQGIIKDGGDSWTTTIKLENGVPTANGQPLSLGF